MVSITDEKQIQHDFVFHGIDNGKQLDLLDKEPIVHLYTLAKGARYQKYLYALVQTMSFTATRYRMNFWIPRGFVTNVEIVSLQTIVQKYGHKLSFADYEVELELAPVHFFAPYKTLGQMWVDVQFPPNVRRILQTDSDVVAFKDMTELWDFEFDYASYQAMTGHC